MLKSEVATGRFMNGEDICIICPECPSLASYDIESKVLEGPTAHFGFKYSETLDWTPPSQISIVPRFQAP